MNFMGDTDCKNVWKETEWSAEDIAEVAYMKLAMNFEPYFSENLPLRLDEEPRMLLDVAVFMLCEPLQMASP